MLRLSALFPVLVAITAFILSLLVILSGRNTDFLNDVYILRVNTSEIRTTSDTNGLLDRLGIRPNSTGIGFLDDAIDAISEVDSVGEIINTVAHQVGLHDFYTAHVTTWCDGAVNSNGGQTVTNCTKPKVPFSFDPIEILEDDLLQGLELEDLGFPKSDIQTAVDALQTAYRVMSVCYLIGCILAGLSFLLGIAGLYASRIIEFLNCLTALGSAVFLGIASAIATAIAIKARNVFNDYASRINVFAQSSDKFLGMTWAAVGLMFLAVVVWSAVCCCGRHTSRTHSDGAVDKAPRRRRFF